MTGKLALVDFGRKNWGFTEQTGFGRFWPKKLVKVDFDWKNGVLTKKKRSLVDLDRKNAFSAHVGSLGLIWVLFHGFI